MSIKPRDAFGPPFPDYAPPPKEDDIQKKKLQINESLKAVLQLVLSRQGGGVPIDAEAYFQNLREIVANLLFLQELTPHDTRQYGSYQRIIKKFEKILQNSILPITEADFLTVRRQVDETGKIVFGTLAHGARKRKISEEAPSSEAKRYRIHPFKSPPTAAKPQKRQRSMGPEEGEQTAQKRHRTKDVVRSLRLTQKVAQVSMEKSRPVTARHIFTLAQSGRKKKISSLRRSQIQAAKPPEAAAIDTPMGLPLVNSFKKLLEQSELPRVAPGLLYGIVDDSMGATSEDLVGYNQIEAWRHFAYFLDKIAASETEEFKETVQKQRDWLKTGIQIYETIHDFTARSTQRSVVDFAKMLDGLSLHESLIIPGGWVGDPGHAMVYGIRLSSPGKYQVAVYNVGAGAEYHGLRSIAEMKEASCLIFDGIDRSQLADPNFFRCLQPFTDLPKDGPGWNAEDVYRAFSGMFGKPTRIEQLPYSELQRSGTCSFASLFAFLHTQLSEKEYGRLLVALGIKGIQCCVHSLESFPLTLDKGWQPEEFERIDRMLALAEKSIINFSRQLLHAEAQGWIDQDDFVTIQKKLSEFEKTIQERRIQFSKTIFLLGPISEKPEKMTSPLSVKVSSYENIDVKTDYLPLILEDPHVQAVSELPSPIPMDLSTVAQIEKTVDNAIRWATLQKSLGNGSEVAHEIERLAPALVEAVRDKESQIAFDPKVRSKLIENLHILGELYVRSLISHCLQTSTEIPSNPIIPATLLYLIDSAVIVGRDVEIIQQYKSTFSAVCESILKNFYSRFEFYSDEQAFIRTAESRPGQAQSVFAPYVEVMQILTGRDQPVGIMNYNLQGDFNSFVIARYKEEVKIALGLRLKDEDIPITALLFENRKKLQSVFPAEFFHFQDLLSLMPFVYESQRGKRKIVQSPSSNYADDPLMAWVVSPIHPYGLKMDLTQKIFESSGAYQVRGRAAVPFSLTDTVFPDLMISPYSYDQSDPARRRTSVIGTDIPKLPELPPPYKDLQLITSDETFQIDTALATFSSSPSLLKQKEWQNFLEAALFSQRRLEQTCAHSALKQTPRLVCDFLKNQLSMALVQPQNIDLAIFLLRLYRRVFERSHLVTRDQKVEMKAEITYWFDNVHRHLEGMSSEQCESERVHWHYERACFLACQPSLSEEEAESLFRSILIARRSVQGQGSAFEYNIGSLAHMVFRRADSIEWLASHDVSPMLNAVISPSSEGRKWKSDPANPTIFFSDDKQPLTYNAVTGIVTMRSRQKIVRTPVNLLSSEMMKRATSDRIPLQMVMNLDNLFSFEIDAIHFHVKIDEDGVHIYKFLGDMWFQFIENGILESRHDKRFDKFSRRPLQKALYEGLNVWCTADKKNYHIRIEARDGTLRYMSQSSDIIDRLQEPCSSAARKEDKLKWRGFRVSGPRLLYSLSEIKGRCTILPTEALPELFSEVEDPEYIIPRSDDGTSISSITFTRFGPNGLTFNYDTQTKTYRNAENYDEILIPNQFFAGTLRLTHKLILMSEKTRKKRILIPCHHMKTVMKKEGFISDVRSALDTRSDLSQSNPEQQITVYSYRKEKDRLIPETTEGALNLAYTYLWQQQYEDAARMLESIPQLPLSEEGVKIIQWLVEGAPHDHDPDSVAVRLKAAAILIRQHDLFNRELQHTVYDTVHNLALDYLSCRHLCTNVFLTSDEAIILEMNPEEMKVRIKTRSVQGSLFPIQLVDRIPPFDSKSRLGAGIKSSIFRPLFCEESFVKLYRIFTSNPAELQKSWGIVKEVFMEAMGIELGEFSQEERGQCRKILTSAARARCSKGQTAAAMLLTALDNPGMCLAKCDLSDKLRLSEPYQIDNLFSFMRDLFQSQKIEDVLETDMTVKGAPLTRDVEFSEDAAMEIEAERADLYFARPVEKIVGAKDGLPMEEVEGHIEDRSIAPVDGRGIFFETIAEKQLALAAQYADAITQCIQDPSPLARQAGFEFSSAARKFVMHAPGVIGFNQEPLRQAVVDIKKESDELKGTLKEDRRKIKSLLSKSFSKDELQSLQASLSIAKTSRTISIKDAINALLAPFPNGFLQLNPALSPDDAQKLRRATVTYLIHKTRQRHLQELKEKCEHIVDKENPSQDEISDVYQLFQTKREYISEEAPEYLVFEDAFGHFLRPQQIQVLRDFLSQEAVSEAKVKELIMAFGKTDVLMPMILYFMAQRGNLSVGIIPSNLFASMAPNIAKALQESFFTQVFSWRLQSDSPISYSALKKIERGLKNAVTNRQVVLIRPEDITGLFLQFLDAAQVEQSDETIKKIELFQSIFSLVATSGAFLFDEVHIVWDVLKEHLLSRGALEPIDPITIHTSMILHRLLSRYRVPDDSSQFIQQISPSLRNDFVRFLMSSEDPILRETAAHEQKLIEEYLEGKRPKTDIQHLPHPIKDMLTVAYSQIQTVLPMTCTAVLGIHYGKESSATLASPYPIPYSEGKPVLGSRFGNTLEEIDYSILMFSKLPEQCLLSFLNPYIKDFHDRARRQLIECPGLIIEETDAVKELQSIFGGVLARKLISSSPEECAAILVKYYADHTDEKMTFIEHQILPKISRPNAFTRVTSQMFGIMSHLLRGFSGTLWNKETYPTSKIPESSEETIGKTLSIVSREDQEVRVVKTASDLFVSNCGIIDIGGALKDQNEKDVARRILEKSDPSIAGVIYHDEHGLPFIVDRQGLVHQYPSEEFKPERLTAFWAHAFTTGVDFKINPQAHCMVYVGKDDLDIQFFQGIWRLRKLGRGQHIHVVISEETEQLIRTKLGLSPAEIVTVHHVIAYGLAKKIDRQATDNYRAFQHKVDGILQKAFFNLLLRIGPEEIPEALKACEALFISEKPSAPFDEYGEILVPVPTRHKLEEVGKKMLESRAYAYLIEKGVLNPIEANRELTALLAMENVLPCTVVDTSSDQQTLVQVQTQTQTQTQTKVVSSVGNIPFSWFERPISIPNFVERGTFDNVFDKTVKFAPFCDYARIIGLRDIFLSTEQTKRFACVIPENVGSSENLHPISEKTFSLFSVYSKPIELALYMSDAKGTFMVALDQHDASAICAEGFFSRDIKKGKVLAIVNIRSGTVHPIDGDAVPPLLHEEFSFLVNRVCLKIFAGDLALTRKERIALLARCSQLGENGFEIMSQYIQEYVCAVHPQAQIAKNGILSLLADKGHTFIRTTISSLIDCAMEDSVLRRQIEVLKAEFEEDPSIANDVMFFERLLACDGQKIIDPVEQARKIYLSKISQLESDADAVLSELKTTFFDPENKVLHLKNFIEVMRTGKKTKIAQKAFEEIEGRLIDLEKRLDCAQEILTINVEAEKVLLSWANGLEGDSLNFKVRFPAPYNREQILPCIAAEVQDCITMFIALKKFQKARNKCWGFGQGIWKNQSGQWIVGWTWKTPQHTAIVNSLNLMTVRLKSIIPKISQQKQRQMEELVSLLSESYHTSAVAQSVYDFSTVLSRS